MMACATRGSIRGVSWHSGTALASASALPRARPLFGVNDNGDINYRAISGAAARLWHDFGTDSPDVAATRAQAAFWQGGMATCRWWHSVARMLDRALVAGQCLTPSTDVGAGMMTRRHGPANA